MGDIARLTVSLHANSAKFVSELNKSKGYSKKWSKDITKSFSDMAKTTGIATSVAAASTVAFAAAIKSSLNSIDEMTRAAANLSIPVQSFGDLAYAAKLSGSSMDQVADVIKDISVRVQDAAFSNSGALVDFFSQINQDAKDWAQLSPDQQFKKFVDEINKMDANQARFWLDEINDSAAEMFGTLYGADATFNKFREEAERAGLSINKYMAGNAQKARIEFDRLGALTTATWQSVVANSSPAIEFVLDGLNDWIISSAKANGGFQNLGQTLSISMITAIQGVTHSFFAMTDEFKNEVRDMGRIIGKDWFVTPDFLIANRQLGQIQEQMEDINAEIRKSSLTNQWMSVSGRQAEEYKTNLGELHEQLRQLRIQEAQIESKMTFKTDTSGFDKQITGMISSISNQAIKSPEMEVKAGGNNGNVQSPFAMAQEQALIGYKEVSQKMIQEQQRRLALLAAGDNAALVQEKFNHEDRIKSLAESYQAAYDANANDKEAQKELQNQYYLDMAAMSSEHESQMTQIKQQEAEKRKDIEGRIDQQITGMKFAVANQALGLIESTSKEGSAIQKAAFIAQKAMAAAQVFIQGEVSAAAALAPPPIGLGPVAGIPQAASIRAMSMVSMGMIAAQAITGMAHSGIDEVPREGTWLLDRGERVYTNRSAKQIDQMQTAIAGLGNSMGSVNWSINIENNQSETKVETYIDDEKKIVSVVLSDINSSGQIYNSLSRKLGVGGGGWK